MTQANDDEYRYYLADLGDLVKTRALEARAERNRLPPASLERMFQSGRLLGFNEVISIMQQQAEGFGIPLEALRLDDIDPDRDLV